MSQNDDRHESGTPQLKNRDWMEQKLRSVEFVDFDRFTVGDWAGEQYVNVYGWIERPDDHEDFVLIIFWPEREELYFTTSSAEHSEEVQKCLFGTTEGHNECHRVEDSFNVSNAIELEAQNV